MDFPSELHYTREHEWVRVEADGTTATIGITEFAQRELGDVVFVELEPEGTEVESDGVFGTVEAVKTVSELFAPVSGTIAEVNPELDSNPEYVNEDPYGQGWMVKIRMDDPSQVEALLTAEDYASMVG
jgi:glycine cleavage system H protein